MIQQALSNRTSGLGVIYQRQIKFNNVQKITKTKKGTVLIKNNRIGIAISKGYHKQIKDN